jgi:hypothetical protein
MGKNVGAACKIVDHRAGKAKTKTVDKMSSE